MIVRLTPEARDNLVAIWLWISRDDEKRAHAFIDELERACDSLVPRPSRFPVALKVEACRVVDAEEAFAELEAYPWLGAR